MFLQGKVICYSWINDNGSSATTTATDTRQEGTRDRRIGLQLHGLFSLGFFVDLSRVKLFGIPPHHVKVIFLDGWLRSATTFQSRPHVFDFPGQVIIFGLIYFSLYLNPTQTLHPTLAILSPFKDVVKWVESEPARQTFDRPRLLINLDILMLLRAFICLFFSCFFRDLKSLCGLRIDRDDVYGLALNVRVIHDLLLWFVLSWRMEVFMVVGLAQLLLHQSQCKISVF